MAVDLPLAQMNMGDKLPVPIAVLNEKGGVGKSTTPVHLARWLQRSGKAVHWADIGPQQTGSFLLQAANPFSARSEQDTSSRRLDALEMPAAGFEPATSCL